jgi:hypothetical protein
VGLSPGLGSSSSVVIVPVLALVVALLALVVAVAFASTGSLRECLMNVYCSTSSATRI